MLRGRRKVRYIRLAKNFGRNIPLQHEDQILFEHNVDRVEKNRGEPAIKPKELVSRYAATRKRYGRRKIGALYAQQRSKYVYHAEGGWTKDIDPSDATETLRYMRKLEKNEDINNTIEKWRMMMEDRITSQELAPLEYMFDYSSPKYLESNHHASVVATYEDAAKIRRPLRHISWLGPGHIVGAYASTPYDKGLTKPTQCYVWDVENSARPLVTLSPESGALCIECHPSSSEILLSGHLSGELCLWDLRLGPKPVEVTSRYLYEEVESVDDMSRESDGTDTENQRPFSSSSQDKGARTRVMGSKKHLKTRDIEDTSSDNTRHVSKEVICIGGRVRGDNAKIPVRAVAWTLNPNGYEVFSGDYAGRIRWWDTRNLSTPVESVNIVIPDKKISNTLYMKPPGVSALEINPKDPNLYMVGTESGHILYGNRAAKSLRMNWKCPAYVGPVNCLERSEECPDVVLAAGDFNLRIFSDELKHNSIMSLVTAPALYTSAAWCPTHGSVVHASRQDGTVETWNLLDNMTKPIYSIKACDEDLMFARCRQEGDLLAVGSCAGTLRLVRYSESVYCASDQAENRLNDLFRRQLSSTKVILDRTSLSCLRNLKVVLPPIECASATTLVDPIPGIWENPPSRPKECKLTDESGWETDHTYGDEKFKRSPLQKRKSKKERSKVRAKGANTLTSPKTRQRIASEIESTPESSDLDKERIDSECIDQESLDSKSSSELASSEPFGQERLDLKLFPFDPCRTYLKSSDQNIDPKSESVKEKSNLPQLEDLPHLSEAPASRAQEDDSSSTDESVTLDPEKLKQLLEKCKAMARREIVSSLPAQTAIREELIPIEREFHSKLVKDAKKDFRKVARQHRKYMLSKFGIHFKTSMKEKLKVKEGEEENEDENEDSDDDSDTECESTNETTFDLASSVDNVKRRDVRITSPKGKKRSSKGRGKGKSPFKRSPWKNKRRKRPRRSKSKRKSRPRKSPGEVSQKRSSKGASSGRKKSKPGKQGASKKVSWKPSSKKLSKSTGKSKTPRKSKSKRSKTSSRSPSMRDKSTNTTHSSLQL